MEKMYRKIYKKCRFCYSLIYDYKKMYHPKTVTNEPIPEPNDNFTGCICGNSKNTFELIKLWEKVDLGIIESKTRPPVVDDNNDLIFDNFHSPIKVLCFTVYPGGK